MTPALSAFHTASVIGRLLFFGAFLGFLAAAPAIAQAALPPSVERQIDSLQRIAPNDFDGFLRGMRALQRQQLDALAKVLEQRQRTVDSIARLLFAIPLRIATGAIDRDPGGYPRSLVPQSDRWSVVHGGGGCATAVLVSALGGSWREALVVTVLASLAHEVAQGYPDPGDMVAEAVGGALCLSVRALL